MRTYILAMIAAVPACLAAVGDDDPPEPGVLANQPVDLEEHRAELAIEAPPTPYCDVVDETGPCSVACDPEALAQYIPKGTCVTFRCNRVDGTFGKYGGCRP